MTRLLLFRLIALGLLTFGCASDPSFNGNTAACPNIEWIPPRKIIYCSENNPVNDVPDLSKEFSVNELLDIALRNNPKTKEAWYNARAAAFSLEASRSAYYPFIDAQESYNFIDGVFGGSTATSSGVSSSADFGGFGGHQETFTRNITISYLLLDFGGRKASVESEKWALYSANWTQNRTLQDVMISVLRAYYAYINAKASFEARHDDLNDAQKNLEAAESLYKAGIKTKVDVLQAKARVVNVQLQIEESQGRMNITMGQIATAMGLPANLVFKVENLPEELPVDQVTENVEQLIEEAKNRRADLASAYADFLQKNEDLKVAKSRALPTLTGNVNLQDTHDIRHPIFDSHLYVESISLNFPIFHGFLDTFNIKNKCEVMKSAFESFQVKKDNVLLDVITSYYAYKTAVQTLKSSEEYLKYATEAYNVIFGGYKEGIGSFLDVLSAQTILSNAREQQIQARTLWVTALSGIAYATGTL